jgi:hypothetical protein
MEMKEMKTKWGNARLSPNGHYHITTRKEGNHGKILARLIYEDYYKITLMPWADVHHIDKNKTNDDPLNFKLMSRSEHISLHRKGAPISEEQKRKLLEANLGKKHSLETRKKMSDAKKGIKLPKERVLPMAERVRGEKNPMAKLTKSQVWTIKRMLDLNYTQTHIGRVFGVDRRHIGAIKAGKRWRHVIYQ